MLGGGREFGIMGGAPGGNGGGIWLWLYIALQERSSSEERFSSKE